jgi:ribonuclease Z
MGLQGRAEPMRLWGPPGSQTILESAVKLGIEQLPFAVTVKELRPDERVTKDGYDIVAYRTRHGTHSIGYALSEHPRLGRFDIERARALGVPEGPLYGRLHRGEDVIVDGRTVHAADVVGPARPGRKVVYTGDTRPCAATVNIARDADVLIHDATFASDESDRAHATGHATAREAADVAHRANVQRLILTHISARYADDARILEREARRVFANAMVAHDGLELEIGFRDATEAEPALRAES